MLAAEDPLNSNSDRNKVTTKKIRGDNTAFDCLHPFHWVSFLHPFHWGFSERNSKNSYLVRRL